MKRLFDITVSFLGLVFLVPAFILISLCIKLNSKGPVFFQQIRVGKKGKLFKLYKFRSMHVLDYAKRGIFEPGNTSRITTIGKFLRKSKIDELPQLLNVLKGDMSLVGPRPEIEKWVMIYPERWKRVLTVKPGITDNASIEFHNEEAVLAGSEDPEKTYKEIILPKKLDLYERYVIDHTFYGDLKLIVKTLIYPYRKKKIL